MHHALVRVLTPVVVLNLGAVGLLGWLAAASTASDARARRLESEIERVEAKLETIDEGVHVAAEGIVVLDEIETMQAARARREASERPEAMPSPWLREQSRVECDAGPALVGESL